MKFAILFSRGVVSLAARLQEANPRRSSAVLIFMVSLRQSPSLN